MGTGGYKIRNKMEPHFLTFTVVDWVDVFTRKLYRDLLIDCLVYCQKEKGLLLHCWCIMSNHMHIIGSATDGNLSDIIRDFKKYTSRQIIESIQNNSKESRRDWMLDIFRKHGSLNVRNKSNQVWIQDNHPIELYSPKFIGQRIAYTHLNPVRAGIVARPEDYLYSSALDYKYMERRGLLDVVFLADFSL